MELILHFLFFEIKKIENRDEIVKNNIIVLRKMKYRGTPGP